MIKNKYISYIAILLVATGMASGLFMQPALADTSASTSAETAASSSLNVNINSINSQVSQLIIIRNNQSISTSTKESEEVAAQQSILNEVIAISTNEISTLQTQLNNLNTFATDSEEYSLQSNYLAELSSYNEYFTKESTIVASASTPAQLQTVAANIKAFRDAGYNNEIYKMVTFALLYYDAKIISTAQSRLSSVRSDLTSLEGQQLLLNPTILDGDVSQAAIFINKASTLHDQASAIILRSSASTTPETEDGATSTPATSATSTRNMIEESVNDIKSAYNLFIDVSTNIDTQLSY